MYLDAAVDRVEAAHETRIEEVRVGYIFARDNKAYQKWQRKHRPLKRGLVGDALEAAVMGIARMFPDNVVRGTL